MSTEKLDALFMGFNVNYPKSMTPSHTTVALLQSIQLICMETSKSCRFPSPKHPHLGIDGHLNTQIHLQICGVAVSLFPFPLPPVPV